MRGRRVDAARLLDGDGNRRTVRYACRQRRPITRERAGAACSVGVDHPRLVHLSIRQRRQDGGERRVARRSDDERAAAAGKRDVMRLCIAEDPQRGSLTGERMVERGGPETKGHGGGRRRDRPGGGDREGDRAARVERHDVLALGVCRRQDACAQLSRRCRAFDRERERARGALQPPQLLAAARAAVEMLLEAGTIVAVERVEGERRGAESS